MTHQSQEELRRELGALNERDADWLRRARSWLGTPDGRRTAAAAARLVEQVGQFGEGMQELFTLERRPAAAVAQLLRLHPAAHRTRPLAVLLEVLGDGEPSPLRGDSAGLLLAGAGVLGSLEARQHHLSDALLHVALGADAVSVLLRQVLTGRPERWTPDLPLEHLGLPLLDLPELDTCALRLGHAMGSLSGYLATFRRGHAVVEVEASADGIDSLVPDSGTCGDLVTLYGSFPAAQPARTSISFPQAGGGCVSAVVSYWGTNSGPTSAPSRIEVLVPGQVGEGPVGFVTRKGQDVPVDWGAPSEFADVLGECFGSAAAAQAGRIAALLPPPVLTIGRSCPPALPSGANLFHGGPVLGAVSRSTVSERDVDPVTLTGRSLAVGDVVEVDGAACPTTFVSSTELRFRLQAVRSGKRAVVVRRGGCRSNGTTIQVTPAFDSGPLARAQPGEWVTVTGTGFVQGQMAVALNGEPALVVVDDTHTLHFRAFRPQLNPPARNKTGEEVTVTVSHLVSPPVTTTFTLDTYRIVVLGDSVVWGQGLTESQKFSALLAQHVAQQFGASRGVYDQDRLAHSGATVLSIPEVPADATAPLGAVAGERPADTPSITAQVAAWAATPQLRAEARHVDLVLIDGGANDVNIRNIIDPFGSDTALTTYTQSICSGTMSALLNQVLSVFPEVGRVVVTGYYQPVSAETDPDHILELLVDLGLVAAPLGLPLYAAKEALKKWLISRLTHRSKLFAATANAGLASAVDTTKDPRVRLAVPAFGPRNAMFAPEPFVFGLGPGPGVTPEDPVAAARASLCDPIADLGDRHTCCMASIAHPNAAGAQAYFEAIKRVL